MQIEKNQNFKTKRKSTYDVDFRLLLQEELLKRCQKNPQYSLRSFAKSLGIAAPTLSKILNGKSPITDKMLMRIASSLCLSSEEVEKYLTFSQNKKRKKRVFHQVDLDRFSVISEWYHFALLELLKIKNIEKTPSSLSKKLGLTVNIVKIAFERLERVGLLKMKKGEFVVCQDSNSFYKGNYTDEALKKLQITWLEKAIERVKDTSLKKRDNTSMTMAISRKDLKFAKEKIKKFRRELSEELESNKNPDSVYQLTVSFFPLIKE